MNKKIIIAVIAILSIFTVSFSVLKNTKSTKDKPKQTENKKGDDKVEALKIKAVIKTNKGNIKLNLFPDKAPVTVSNFINLSNQKYYDGIKFHRVIEDFMVQGGDPTGTGAGGPGYRFEDEVNNGLDFSVSGKLAMANAGKGTNGSQFFITTVPTDWLNNNHTIFGELESESDMTVLKSITQGDTIESVEIIGDDQSKLLDTHKSRIEEWNKALGK